MPHLIICPCQHCSGKIEFDPANLSGDNNVVACPHCSLETILFVRPPVNAKIETVLSVTPPPPPSGLPSGRNATAESIFFQSGDITVTNARFIVGSQTFAMRSITSVQGVEIPARYGGPIILVFFGILIALFSFNDALGLAIFGILIIVIGVWLAIRQKRAFAVVLRTAGGEVTAYQSRDRNHISQIIQALNESMISHG